MSALIDDDLPGGYQIIGDPMLATGQSIRFRQYQRAARVLLGKDFFQYAVVATARDDRRNSRSRSLFRGIQLSRNTTRPNGTETLAGDGLTQALGFGDQWNQFGVLKRPRVFIVNAFDVAQDNQQIRFKQRGHQRR